MNRIKQLREENDIKQRELANLLGVEVSAISKLEIGRVPLKDEYIIKLANFFNVTTDYLLGKSSNRTENIKQDYNDAFIAFYEGYKDLEDEDKEVIQATINALKKKKKKK